MRAAMFAGLALAACTGGGPLDTGPDASPPRIPDGAPPTDPDAGPDPSPDAAPAVTEIAACDDLAMTSDLTLMPSPVDAHYLRCETRGAETGRDVVISADASRLAVRTTTGTVRLFSTQPWKELAQLTAPIGRIDAMAFSADGAWLATFAAEMGEVTLWRAGDAARDRSFALTPADMMNTTTSAVTFSSDGAKLAVSSPGAVVDLATGVITDEPFGASARLAFAPGDGVVFSDEHYQIGNSPTSERLRLVDLATGTSTILFDRYDRALLGYALSADGALIAFGATEENGVAPGLHVIRTADGAPIASDATSTDTVVGFTHDAARLIVVTGSTVRVLDAGDLHQLSQLAVTDPSFLILGVSPEDELVVASGDHTSWWSIDAGTVRGTLSQPLDRATWANGYGAGTGSGPFFALWREGSLEAVCTPAATSGGPVDLAALGTVVPGQQSVTTDDGSTTVADELYLHGHATNYDTLRVTDAATGLDLRRFAPSSSRTAAVTQPDGARLYTEEGSNANAAGWCR